jgi:hypothetical protein
MLRLLHGAALGQHDQAKLFAAHLDLRGAMEIVGSAVEIGRVVVQAAGHLAHAWADRFVLRIDGVVDRREAARRVSYQRGECHQRRTIFTRPLTVSTCRACCPLLRNFLPVVASCGGGKSGFRRDDFLLHGRLVGEPHELLARVADLLLRVGDQPARLGGVHRGHDLLGQHLDLTMQERLQLLRRNLRQFVHDNGSSKERAKQHFACFTHSPQIAPVKIARP